VRKEDGSIKPKQRAARLGSVADYPFENVISRPTEPTLQQTVAQMMLYMPPQLLGEPGIYFAIILAFVFVLVVYI